MFPFQDLTTTSSITWFQREVYGDTTNAEYGNLLYDKSWHSGTGYGQLNKAFFSVDHVSSGQSKQIDLFNLTRNIFDRVFTSSFNGDKIKLIYIENTSSGSDQNLFLVATGQNSFTNLFSYAYLGTTIKPNSYVIFADRYTGASCDSNDRYFYLQDINNRGPILYELGIFGVSF